MCGVRFGAVAVLFLVPLGAGRDLATVVRAMRGAGLAPRRVVPGLSAGRHRDRAGTVRVRRADPSRDPSVEVRGVARRRGCAGSRDDRDVGRHPVDAQRHHVGAAVPRATRGTRLRPGPRAGAGDRPQDGRTRPPARAAARGPGTAGSPRGGLRREAMRGVFEAEGGSGRVVLVDDVLTTGATGGACAAALLEGGAEAVGLLTAARAVSSARRPRPILGHGLASGSVVAPGNGSPAVDASRGRSDPRKPTLGR
jgi:hypothetical protein